jgi:uncharacterized cysteine cluster protein YcgN (CxxCxxCC family)
VERAAAVTEENDRGASPVTREEKEAICERCGRPGVEHIEIVARGPTAYEPMLCPTVMGILNPARRQADGR